MHFEEINRETLYIALEIINSNPEYNVLENDIEVRTHADMEKEFLNPDTTSVFIKLDETYIGVIDYMPENPKDHFPWLGLLIIHADYQGYGFGAQAYTLLENELLMRRVDKVRIGVIKENIKAQRFWELLGFSYYTTASLGNEKEIFCYQKSLV